MTKRTSKSNRRRHHPFRNFLLLITLLCGIGQYFFPQQTGVLLEALDEYLPQQTAALSDDLRLLLARINPKKPVVTPGEGDFQVHFLDVGQGLSVFVRSGEHTLLYDGGDRDTSSFVVAYLKQQEVTKLDYVIASHYDADHISGLIGALHAFSVETVIGPDYVHDSQTYESFQNAVSDCGLAVSHPGRGTVYPLGGSSFTILSPMKITEDSNNNSVAIRIVNGQNSFLLAGDAESESEEQMCLSGLELQSDVLCPGHHGSESSTSSLFLSFVRPRYAVISVGRDNDYGHPHDETLQRLALYQTEVYRTDVSGTVVALSDGETISWKLEKN